MSSIWAARLASFRPLSLKLWRNTLSGLPAPPAVTLRSTPCLPSGSFHLRVVFPRQSPQVKSHIISWAVPSAALGSSIWWPVVVIQATDSKKTLMDVRSFELPFPISTQKPTKSGEKKKLKKIQQTMLQAFINQFPSRSFRLGSPRHAAASAARVLVD